MINKDLLAAINDFAEQGNKVDYEELQEHMGVVEKANASIHEVLITARMKKFMKDFGERDTDVYVITFPKSGTTLMQMILYQMTTDGNMDFAHLYDVSPWARQSAFVNQPMASVGDRRIIKSHDEYELLKEIRKGKFIFVIRDCLDVISSFYEHIRDYSNPSVDFAELSQRKMKAWLDYNTTWLQNERKLDVFYVHYEDIIADKKKVVAEIADFIGCAVDEERHRRIMERTSFAFMKQHEAKFGEQPQSWKVYNNFIRKGAVGTGRDKFTAEQLADYNNLLRLGSGHIRRYLKESE